MLVAHLDPMQQLKRPKWREVAAKAIDGPPDPNLVMPVADAFALPESRLQSDPARALKAGTKLAPMSREPMFLIRLAWAQHAKGQTPEALKTLAEATRALPKEKERNPASYEDLERQLEQATAYIRSHGGVLR